MTIQGGSKQSSKSLWFLIICAQKKERAVMSKYYNLHKLASNPSLALSVQWLAQRKQPRGDIYFWQLEQIKTHIRPYVTTVSATQSSTFQHQPLNLLLLCINNAKYITHWQQCLSPQFMFQQPHSTRDNLYLSMQALCDAFKGGGVGAM